MATRTIGFLDWIEELLGHETVYEFAPPTVTTGDVVDISGVRWLIYARRQDCPYISLPAQWAGSDYTLTEAWLYLVNIERNPRYVLTDYVPERYLVDLIERGE